MTQQQNPYEAPKTKGHRIKRKELPPAKWAALVTCLGMLLGFSAAWALLFVSGAIDYQLSQNGRSLILSATTIVSGVLVGGLVGSYVASRIQKNRK